MKKGLNISLNIEVIENGFLVSAEKREGYRNAVTGQTYYARLKDVEDALADTMDRATDLELPTNDDEDGMPF